jgi:peptidyl-prolyl cis-trans isomerase SurA
MPIDRPRLTLETHVDVNMLMRKFTLLLALCVALPAVSKEESRRPQAVPLDRIVAVVNNEVVTRLDLDEQVKIALQQLKRQGTPLPARDVLERQLLERLVTS